MSGPRIGELFAGYGGLGMGAQAVLGGSLAWVSEYEPPTKANPNPTQAAARILAHRFPAVPNHGDITRIDWATVEPVDVLTGGFPCQDVSHAGKRLGIHPDSRSGLWTHMAYAISQLRPPLVVIENVRGLLSAPAHGVLESCAWCVGDGERFPLRALGAVLGDLADLGYDASWAGVRASDVGAPHSRFRVFVAAWPADADLEGLEGAQPAAGRLVPYRGAAADAADDGRQRGRQPRPGRPRPTHHSTGTAAHASGAERRGTQPDHLGAAGRRTPELGERPSPPADPQGAGRAGQGGARPDVVLHGPQPAHGGASRRGGDRGHPGEPTGPAVAWGQFEPAIRRWERALGRLAPAPTDPGSKGQPRLSPAFVEWLMGLPDGWVTAVPGLTRNDQLKALGNGVVPQQAAHALRLLLADTPAAEGAA